MATLPNHDNQISSQTLMLQPPLAKRKSRILIIMSLERESLDSSQSQGENHVVKPIHTSLIKATKPSANRHTRHHDPRLELGYHQFKKG